MKKQKIVIDLFAGAGGESCGIHSAFNAKGEDIKLFAVNHWESAFWHISVSSTLLPSFGNEGESFLRGDVIYGKLYK